MLLFIYFCILILNVVAVLLNYRFLGQSIEKKDKWIFMMVGIAVMYLLVSIIYGISTKEVDLGQASTTTKNLITFTFVPVNGILILPFIANSYRYYREGRLKVENFRNRVILLAVVLVVVLLIEFFYFKDIQTGILNMIQAKQQ